MFEVEKKFKVPHDFKHILLEKGWKFEKEVHFTDTYFDTENYQLFGSDHWLRKRDGQWQLKCPEKRVDCTRVDKYMEIEGYDAVIDRLALILKADNSILAGKTANEAIKMLALKPVVEFETYRVKYTLDRFKIDLDQTNFGYELGEIELMCKDRSEMEVATGKILDMACKLGVDIHEAVTGKIGTYLKMNNKIVYDELVSKGILVDESE